MTPKLWLEGIVSLLPATWPKSGRWLIWVGDKMRRVDVRKPLHALIIGVMIGGMVAPVLGYMADEARYHLFDDETKVMTHASDQLGGMLKYDQKDDAVYFNKDGQPPAGDDGMVRVGSEGGKQPYSAKIPTKAGDGIKLTDTQHQVSATMFPQYSLMDGRKVGNRVLYPLKDTPGVLALTPKGNGVKEDIVLDRTVGDRVQYDYQLKLDDGLQARLLANGAVGVFSGDPALFGNISFSTDKDRARVMNVRDKADKTYLMFEIPAPVVKQADGGAHGVKAHFVLNGNTLSVVATGLAKAAYPLSIDPSFVITSTSDFLLGKVEDNLTLTQPGSTDGQLNRAPITGGLVSSWSSTSSAGLPTTGGPGGTGCSSAGTDYNFGLTAYNGYLYLAGGGNGGGTYVCYAAINSNGTLGNWAATSQAFTIGRTGTALLGFNGYLYVIGGENANGGSRFKDVESAPVSSTGDITTAWSDIAGNAIGFARAYMGAAEYNGYFYVCGGALAKNNGTLVSTCEYTQINSDGTLTKPSSGCTLSGTATNWCTASSFTTARDRFAMVSYNGYLYIAGGYSGTAALSDVQYVTIQNDNSLATWTTTTAFTNVLPSGWRSGGLDVEDGYMYLVGGCSTSVACSGLLNGTYFAVVNADGTVGQWDTSTSITTARFYNSVAAYNGVLYSVGGCTSEPNNNNNCLAALGDTQYAIINATINSSVTYPGDLKSPASGGSVGTGRNGTATLAYDGYLYVAGGCNGTNCGTAVTNVDSAPLNDDGTVGTWTAQTGLPAVKYGGAMAGFGGKVYFLGGTGSGSTAGSTTVYSATPSSGSITSWTTETNTFASPRYWLSAANYQNYIYIMGGTGTGGPFNTVEYTQVTGSGTFASPSNCVTNGGTLTNNWCKVGNTFTTARYGFGGVAYYGYLYVVAGVDGSGNALSDTQKAAISSADGYVGSFSSSGQASLSSTSVGHKFVGATVLKSVIYLFGGINTAGTPAVSNSVSFGTLDASGNVTAWNTSARTLTTARWGAGATSYGGRLYAVGGCSVVTNPCTTYLASAEYATAINGGTGVTSLSNGSAWPSATTTPTLPTARGDLMSVAYNGNLYIIGGCDSYSAGACVSGHLLTEVRHATINQDGSIGSWSATSGAGADAQLSTGRAFGGAIGYSGRIYLVGGATASNAYDSSVLYATLSTTGVITGWTDTSSQSTSGFLPAGRKSFGIGTSNGYMYVAGGLTNPGGTATLNNDVLYTEMSESGPTISPICSDGTLTNTWCDDTTNSFATPRTELSAMGYASALYVSGGYDSVTTGGNNLGDVQYATLNTDGSLNAFKYTNYQDLKGRARPMVGANGFMYFFGDESSGTEVQYAPINANNTLGQISRASSAGMPNAHAHAAVAFNDGYFYVMGGCTLSSGTCSTAINNVDYVGQKAEARKGHYSKMFNTEVNTSPTLVQVNGTGQYVVTMRTAAVGSTTFGVPQNIVPDYANKFYFLKALDGSGTDVGIAFNYYIFLTIDDTYTGTFPDTGSVATDINIFYHPNPGRRLRHGASFTNTGCNRVIANGCLLDTAQ